MSLKQIITKLDDTNLYQMFLEFVQKYALQYEKIYEEISYKCYEATWILATIKATGYGRSQPQAYKHALKNLFQLLIQDPMYRQFFIIAFKEYGYNQKKMAIKEQIKTEANQTNKCYSQQKFIESQTKNSIKYKKPHLISSVTYNKQDKKEVYHSKIVLNKNVFSIQNKNQQLIRAKNKMNELTLQLKSIRSENQMIMQRLNKQNYISRQTTQPSKMWTDQSGRKINIPKLKLQILPNYHKNSEKVLNQSLLLAYNQKHNTKIVLA